MLLISCLLLRAAQSAETAGLADAETATIGLDEVADLRERRHFRNAEGFAQEWNADWPVRSSGRSRFERTAPSGHPGRERVWSGCN